MPDKIKTWIIAPYGIPMYKSHEATELWLWTFISVAIESVLVVFFSMWLLFHGGGQWEPRFVAYAGIAMVILTGIVGALLCKWTDKNINNKNSAGRQKGLLTLLVIATLVLLISLTVKLQ